jgi:YD repeat-containing protein
MQTTKGGGRSQGDSADGLPPLRLRAISFRPPEVLWMRRYVAGVFVLLLIGQSSGAALAGTTTLSGAQSDLLTALVGPVRSAIENSNVYALATGTENRYQAMHLPATVMERPQGALSATHLMHSRRALEPRIRQGVRRDVEMPPRSAIDPRHPRRDPLAMRPSNLKAPAVPSSAAGSGNPARRGSHPLSPQRGGRIKPQISSSTGTGVEHWWTYEERAIPGIGKAMVNVGTGNFIVSAMDADIAEQGIDLTFQRVYNSQSLHDYNGDDGGDRAIFGNRWTNTFDANIVYDSVANTITVYDLSGTACTYTSNGNGGWVPCRGEYSTLAPTDGTDCTYAWAKPNGTVYWFHTDATGSGCGIQQAKLGRIQEIFARNQTNYITFAYSYNGSGHGSEDITEIDVNHSDGDTLKMIFGIIPGTTINELKRITRPDSATLQYLYDTSGNLVEVDKPGNNSASSISNPPPTLPQGDVPETYTYASSTLQEVCGPRCTAAMWAHPNNPIDGGALLFIANASAQLTSWQFQGVLNFTPPDGTGTLLQSGLATGFTTWYTANFVYGQGSACSNSSAGTTTMCDTDGHSTIWTTDSSDRVTQVQNWTGTVEGDWLVTSQTWDGNNNLTSTSDANGNTTKYGYDTGGYNQGNMVEMQLPRANDITGGPLSPLSYYSYDQYHNVTAYCDPVYNQNNGNAWVDSPGDNLCPGGNKTTSLTFNQTTNEPFGCLANITKPSGYSTNLSYTGGGCGVGLPSEVQAAQAISQYDGTSRTPTQDFGYDGNGNLTSYDRGMQNGNTLDSWTLKYDKENLLMQRTENDPTLSLSGSSFTCHYADGSTFYTESPSQHDADGDPSCPSTTTLLSGNVAPPSKANTYFYDLDGDQVKAIQHKGCSANNGCFGASPATACVTGESNPAGTTCKYYDGLDRLVETIAPYDSRSFDQSDPYEFYAFRWMNRYIYDLSQSGGSANLRIADTTGTISGIVAYGNLYKTEEDLPSQAQNGLAVLSHKQYMNGGWSDVRGASFDGLDRPIGKYELAYGTTAVTTNRYDEGGDSGNLTSTKNAVGQIISYTHDSLERVNSVSFSGASPLADPRTYTFDADGRTATAKNALGTLSNTYDVDGNQLSVTEPSYQTQNVYAASLICYAYYPDGLREYLSIGPSSVDKCSDIPQQKNPSNGGISQPNIFSYSYEHDGHLTTQQVNWITAQETFSWNYAPSGRELTETDPLHNAQACMPPNETPCINFKQKTYQYDTYGRVSQLTLPEGYQETSFIYDTDDETAGYTDNGTYNRKLTLDARGELISDGAGAYQTAQAATFMANGTQVGNGISQVGGNFYSAPPNALQFDVRSGMVTVIPDVQSWSLGNSGDDVYSYDGAGRRFKEDFWSQWPGGSGTNVNSTQYDAENHIETTKANGSVNDTIQWGPDGRERLETFGNSAPDTINAAHWDGDTLLFAAQTLQGNGPGSPVLYIGKLAVTDVSGDINIIDRDQTGAQQTSRGNVLQGGYNWYEGWSLGSLRSIQSYNPKLPHPINVQIATGNCDFYGPPPAYQYYPCMPAIAPVFAMGRADGYSMGGGVVQGARTFDPTSGQWLTPDAYAGDVHDPMSQKPFMWNGNNPVEFQDPSGYAIGYIDPGLVNMLAYMINNSSVFMDRFIAMARDPKVTYSFTIGPIPGGFPGQSTVSPTSAVMQIAPGTREQELDAEAHEAGGHGGLLASEGYTNFQNDVRQTNMCAAGQHNGCTNNEIKAENTQRSVDTQLGIPCSCPYQRNSASPTSSNIDPSTGFSKEFESNAAQAEDFTNAQQQYIY